MDCVTCDKCRVWGKLQILGLGASIKVLLTPEDVLHKSLDLQETFLTRQEVIAMINTLHQLSQSVLFAAKASEIELDTKLANVKDTFTYAGVAMVVFVLPIYFLYKLIRKRRQKKSVDAEESN